MYSADAATMDEKIDESVKIENVEEEKKKEEIKSLEHVKDKKRSKEEKSKKKDDKSLGERFLKEIRDAQSLEDKLDVIRDKYTDVADENRRLQLLLRLSDKKIMVLEREKEQLQNERRKARLTRERLEDVCRELQKQNKAVKEASLLKSKQEDEMRKNVSEKFKSGLAHLTMLMNQNMERNAKMYEENMEMRKKFKSVYEYVGLKEQELQKSEQQMKLDLQLADAKIAKVKMEATAEKETMLKEKRQLLYKLSEYEVQIRTLQATEVALRSENSMYTDKYDEFQNALTRSNKVYGEFNEEMERMSKKILTLEKETSLWKQKWENSHAAILEMSADKQLRDSEIATLTKKLTLLQDLCKMFQCERANLLAQLKKKNEPLPPETPPADTQENAKTIQQVDEWSKDCIKLQNTFGQLRASLSKVSEAIQKELEEEGGENAEQKAENAEAGENGKSKEEVPQEKSESDKATDKTNPEGNETSRSELNKEVPQETTEKLNSPKSESEKTTEEPNSENNENKLVETNTEELPQETAETLSSSKSESEKITDKPNSENDETNQLEQDKSKESVDTLTTSKSERERTNEESNKNIETEHFEEKSKQIDRIFTEMVNINKENTQNSCPLEIKEVTIPRSPETEEKQVTQELDTSEINDENISNSTIQEGCALETKSLESGKEIESSPIETSESKEPIQGANEKVVQENSPADSKTEVINTDCMCESITEDFVVINRSEEAAARLSGLESETTDTTTQLTINECINNEEETTNKDIDPKAVPESIESQVVDEVADLKKDRINDIGKDENTAENNINQQLDENIVKDNSVDERTHELEIPDTTIINTESQENNTKTSSDSVSTTGMKHENLIKEELAEVNNVSAKSGSPKTKTNKSTKSAKRRRK